MAKDLRKQFMSEVEYKDGYYWHKNGRMIGDGKSLKWEFERYERDYKNLRKEPINFIWAVVGVWFLLFLAAVYFSNIGNN